MDAARAPVYPPPMVSATIVLFLLSVVACLAIGYLEGGRVGTPLQDLAPMAANRTRIGVKLYYASFATAALAAIAAMTCAIGGEVSSTIRAAMPALLVAAIVLFAVTAGTLVWSRWTAKA